MSAPLPALRASVAARRAELDALRPLPPAAVRALDHLYDLELTYTSNAIEGNTLTALETALVVERGITVGGKPLRDHLEAVDHHEAVGYVRGLAGRGAPITEGAIRSLHALVVRRSAPEIAGRYAEAGRYVLTDRGRHAFPSPAEVPALMGDLGGWLREAPDTAETAFRAHLELVGVHPFDDGNGRTARLLMNLVLLRAGYPPVSVRPEDRLAYLRALQAAQAGEGTEAYDRVMFGRLDATLGDFVGALREASAGARPPGLP